MLRFLLRRSVDYRFSLLSIRLSFTTYNSTTFDWTVRAFYAIPMGGNCLTIAKSARLLSSSSHPMEERYPEQNGGIN